MADAFRSKYFTTAEPVRLAFCYLFKPKPGKKPTDRPKFSVTIVVPKTSQALIAQIKAAAEEVLSAKFGTAVRPPNIRRGIKDGDQPNNEGKTYPALAGAYYLDLSTFNQPTLVAEDAATPLTALADSGKLYAGCFANVHMNAYWYDTDGNKGVAWGLSMVQRVRDGEKLGGNGGDPRTAFKPVSVPGSAAAGNGDDMADLMGG